ncbi:hypothetical protein ACN9MB_13125 [Dyella kyungheensis]|uniref:hypothetical protein n=1 Tax=Dyella kyungheensis TaxID=1242174 RepID=UPI003CFAE9FE
MTITLHWWMLPVAILLVGFFIAWRHEDQGGYMPDLTGAAAVLGSILFAGAICLGHWL